MIGVVYLLILLLLSTQALLRQLHTNGSGCLEICLEYGTCNPESERCECPITRHGLDCSIPLTDPTQQCALFSHTAATCHSHVRTLCLNGCNRNGWCEGGFCQCKPGFYGADCSLSTGADGRPVLLAGQGYVPRRQGVKIYVYELPPVTNTWVYIARVDRPLVQLLMQRLLSAGARTANGDEADFFFIPFMMRKRAHTAGHLRPSIHYIRQHWPWWDRHQGHRHLLVAPGDTGRSVLTGELRALTANCTFLTHWGLHSDHAGGHWDASHRPGKDIVVPPLTNPDDPIVYSPLHPGIRAKPKPRVAGLFFAGRICGDSQKPVNGRCSNTRLDYSANTRQRMSEHHWHRPNWTITTHSRHYAAGLATHRFCLSPTGGGYGRRSVQALLMGCIPVTITDGVHQPFEPELSWPRFSVPLAEKDIPYTHHILGALTDQDVKGIQGALRCAAQHMYFSSTFGEVMGDDGRFDAFETLMEVLRMRRDRPDLAPERYMQEDQQFADFANCRLKPTGGRVPLCTQNRLAAPGSVVHCHEMYGAVPMRWMRAFYSWPGGAACGNGTNLAACPRSWL